MPETVTVKERHGFALATIMARKTAKLAAIGAGVGLAPPTKPGLSAGEGLALIGTGPGTWLAVAENPAPDWMTELERKLAGLASVFDQSGGYVVFRISGAGARALLQRGAYIDLHPDVFGPGAAAVTIIAHIGVVLWQLDDAPTFEVALFRSYAVSFRHWIDATAAAL